MAYSPSVDPTRLLVVVDGTNLVNRAGAFVKNEARPTAPKELPASYFQTWFDIDRLVMSTLAGTRLDPWRDLGTVIFHSANALGREPYRFTSSGTGKLDDVQTFWARQGSNPNTSTMMVQIAGGPTGGGNGKAASECEECQKSSEKEKAPEAVGRLIS